MGSITALRVVCAGAARIDRGRGQRAWPDDEEARRIFTYARQKAAGHPFLPCYTVSDALPETIVEVAATIRAAQLVLGTRSRQGLVSLLRGEVLRHVASLLPEEIHLVIYA